MDAKSGPRVKARPHFFIAAKMVKRYDSTNLPRGSKGEQMPFPWDESGSRRAEQTPNASIVARELHYL